MPGPETVQPSVIDSVSSTNFKVLADGPAFYHNLAMGNAIQSQNRQSIYADAAMGVALKRTVELDNAEASAQVKASTSSASDLPHVLSALAASLSANTQAVKAAINTPPTS